MSKHYGEIAFTDAVRDVQDRYGGGAFYKAKSMRAAAAESCDALTDDASITSSSSARPRTGGSSRCPTRLLVPSIASRLLVR